MAHIATFQGRAAQKHVDTVKRALMKLARQSRRASGTIRYEFYQHKDNPAVFLLFGIWESEAAWQAHVAGDAHEQYVASLPAEAWANPPVETRLEALEDRT